MPPVVIGGVIAAAGAIGASALSAKSNSKAIKTATAAQTSSDAAQLGFQREARAENTLNFQPFMARGNQAGDIISGALGIGGGTSGTPGAVSPALAATQAYELFKQSTGYQTRFDEGNRSLAANYFGGGVGQSGAAVKAAIRYGEGFASNEFGNWLGALQGQQNLGFSGASALAGVSQNFADRASGISQNGADMAGQAAVARAQNTGALYTGIANSVGNAIGALSSYRTPAYNPALTIGAGPVVNNYAYG